MDYLGRFASVGQCGLMTVEQLRSGNQFKQTLIALAVEFEPYLLELASMVSVFPLLACSLFFPLGWWMWVDFIQAGAMVPKTLIPTSTITKKI